MAKTTKIVGYGISFDMKLVGGVKTADDFKRAAKSIEKSLNRSSNATKQHELQMEALNKAYRKGAMGTKEYEQALNSLKYKELRRKERLEKERRAVEGLDKQEARLAKNRQQRARVAGMAASGVSGLGLGGRAAGAARFLGGSIGLGPSALALGGGFAGASMIGASVKAYAELEKNLAAIQVLFGKSLGTSLQKEFRKLAETTILTNSQLMENAKIWASYGLTTDGLTDRLKRLGTVAGGNSEKFRALTIAFAQVNAQGKLMGQEKNQLINAGFSLQAVAKTAGISMNDFAKKMEDGAIKAEHLNQALVNVTSEGGIFNNYLEKTAETLSGKFTILESAWEKLLQTLGESEKGPAGKLLDKMIEIIRGSEKFIDAVDRIYGPDLPSDGKIASGYAGEKAVRIGKEMSFQDPKDILRFFSPLHHLDRMSRKLFGIETPEEKHPLFRKPLRLRSAEEVEKAMFEQRTKYKGTEHPLFKYIQGMPMLSTLLNRGSLGTFDTVVGQQRAAGERDRRRMGSGPYGDPLGLSLSQQQEAARLRASQLEEERKLNEDRQKLIKAIMAPETTAESYSQLLQNVQSELLKETFGPHGGIPFGEYGQYMVGGYGEGPNIMEQMAKDAEDARMKAERDAETLSLKEEALIESKIQIAKEVHEREKKRLDAEEEAISGKLERELKVARGAADRDAMFTGGSVEEFMFLRRQTQKNETALAVQAAEDRAAQQRAKIAADKKTLDDELLEQVRQLNVNLELARTQDSK